MKLALVNTKGGAGKSTAAVYLATGLSADGKTLFVDCDPQGSAASWLQSAVKPFDFTRLARADVAKRLPALSAGYKHVVMDTPPGNLPIITSAVEASEAVLVPLAPTGIELNRVVPTLELLAVLGQQYAISVAILLCRMKYSTSAARGVRSVLAENGWPVMETEIPEREVYAQAFGSVPSNLGHFEPLIKELLT